MELAISSSESESDSNDIPVISNPEPVKIPSIKPPTPIEKIENIQKYTIQDTNENKYEISFYLTKSINFEVKKIGEIIPEMYFNSFDLSTLNNICKIFSLCNTCKEAFDYINEFFKQKKASINNLNENLNIIVMIPVMMKEQEVTFNLKKKVNKKDDLILQLCDVMKEMKKEILELKLENSSLKERISKIEKWKKEEEEEKKRREEEEKKRREEEEKKKFPSLIMTKKEQKELIIKKFEGRGKKINSLNLLFRASRDGDQSSVVHNKIDGKNEIIMIVETIKGLKFGGYTQIGFDSSNQNKNDSQAFLFSFDKNKTYDNNGNYAIYCYSSDCPYFFSHYGNYNIKIPNSFYSNNGYTTKKGDCFYTTEDYELNGGEEQFRVKELEYFQINYN